jgi:hypothetical protein
MENLYNNSDKHLVPFFRELADSIESRQLPADQLKCISEFYMSYKFHEQRNGNSKKDEEGGFEEMDVVKFITMGWYIYKFILDSEIVPESTTEDNDQSTSE